jgi:hypothetical protein
MEAEAVLTCLAGEAGAELRNQFEKVDTVSFVFSSIF